MTIWQTKMGAKENAVIYFINSNIKLIYVYNANFKGFDFFGKKTLKGSKLDFLYV